MTLNCEFFSFDSFRICSAFDRRLCSLEPLLATLRQSIPNVLTEDKRVLLFNHWLFTLNNRWNTSVINISVAIQRTNCGQLSKPERYSRYSKAKPTEWWLTSKSDNYVRTLKFNENSILIRNKDLLPNQNMFCSQNAANLLQTHPFRCQSKQCSDGIRIAITDNNIAIDRKANNFQHSISSSYLTNYWDVHTFFSFALSEINQIQIQVSDSDLRSSFHWFHIKMVPNTVEPLHCFLQYGYFPIVYQII